MTIVTTAVKCIIIKMLLALIFIACVAELLKQKSKINDHFSDIMFILLYRNGGVVLYQFSD